MCRLHKYSHSVGVGGYHFVQRTKNPKQVLVGETKKKLEKLLEDFANRLKLQDLTIKVYPSHFHVIFVQKNLAPIDFINGCRDMIKENFKQIEWDEEYIFDGIYDTSKEYVERFLKELGLEP